MIISRGKICSAYRIRKKLGGGMDQVNFLNFVFFPTNFW